MGEKVVFLASGGLDSTIGMALLLDQGYEIYPLHVSRGATADARELDAAVLACERLQNMYPDLMDRLEFVSCIFPPHLWKRAYYPADVERLGHPMRDIMLQSLGVQYAENLNSKLGLRIKTVMVGQTCDEVIPHANEGVLAIASVYAQLDRGDESWSIRSPFLKPNRMTKADVVRYAIRLNYPIEETWSCFEGGPEPCGECQECVRRKEAIDKALRQQTKQDLGTFGESV